MLQCVGLRLAVALAVSVAMSASALAAEKFTQPIGEVFEKGMGAFSVRLAEDGQGVILQNHTLIEDDGPGIGTDGKWFDEDERSPTEVLSGDLRFKKILVVDRPEALEARFCIRPGAEVTLNGSPVSEASRGGYPQFPVALLKKGENEVILAPPAGRSAEVRTAKRQHILENAPDRGANPPRSFVSKDAGKTWQPYDGEFYVRFHLVQYAAKGHLLSPVIDLAKGENLGVLQPALAVRNVALQVESDTPEGTTLQLSIRTGSSPAYEKEHWSAWQPAAQVAVPAGHRYLQWRAELATTDAARTPVLKNVAVEAEVAKAALPAWAAQVKVVAVGNDPFRYTSMPFQYEDPNHPKMKALREKYKLDEVIAPGKTEMEKLVLLRTWVHDQWRYKAPSGHYPAWDADEIITRKIGFCVQYAIVYMQCATALGYQTRFFFGNNFSTGHEVVEVWSNEYRKWIYLDPNNNMHHYDLAKKEPMSILEVRDAILATYYEGKTASSSNSPKELKTSDTFATCYKGETVPVKPDETPRKKPLAWGGKDGKYFVPPYRWMVIRYLPRNNFLSQPIPVPRMQGSTPGWTYPDFWSWDDGRNATIYHYRYYTARRSDLDWTLNQVRFDAAYASKPKTLSVQMCTVTPYFDTYLVNLDGQGWNPAARTVDWTLHAGKNRLEMRVRNSSGVLGPVSFLEVECP